MLKNIINRTFGLRDGEIYISFLMQLYIFLIISVLLIVKPIVNALFLNKLGAQQLPYGYLLVALVAVLTTFLYSKAIRNFSLLKVTILSLTFFSLGFLTLSIVLHYNVLITGVLYVYYLGVSLFAVIATSQFWILANMVFNAREAKRLFGFIGAGAIAGGIFGGYLTSIIVSSYGNKIAMLVSTVLILCCIPIIKKIWKLRISKMNTYIRRQRKYNDDNTQVSSIKLISKSKHLTYLALITGIGVIVAKLVDFQFSDFANKAISDTNELASFFGFWFSTFNVIALVLQLFVTNRILSRFDVSSTMLVLPLGIALGSLLFLTFPELWVLVIIKGIDGSLKQSLNKAAVELSIMPIPYAIKNQTKSFIDVAVDSIATGIAGFMLIFLIKKLDLSTSYITVIVILFVFVWIILIYRLREAYFNSFRTNLQLTVNSQENNKQYRKRYETTIAAAKRILSTEKSGDILILLARLSNFKIVALKTSIVNLLEHPSHKVKAEAIKQLYKYDKGTAIKRVEALVDEKDDGLVYTALDYIIHHSNCNANQIFDKYLDHKTDYISNAALLCLAKEAGENIALSEKFNLDSRIGKRIRVLNTPGGFKREEAVAEMLITVAHSNIEKHFSFITNHLKNKDSYIVKHAIKAAGITADERFVENLLAFLSEKEYRRWSINALKNYGPRITKTILAYTKTEELHDNVKQHIPKVIQSFNTQNSVKILVQLLNSNDVTIRFEAANSLLKLKEGNENLFFNKRIFRLEILRESDYYKETVDTIFSIQNDIKSASQLPKNNNYNKVFITRQRLIDILEEQLELSLSCIFKLLSIVYNESDIKVSYSGLLSDDNDAKMNALEFLDNVLKNQLKTRVLPLVEHAAMEKHNSDSSVLKVKVLPERLYISRLLKKRDKRIKLELLYLIKQLDDISYMSLLSPLKDNSNKEIKHLANEVIEGLTDNDY